MKPHQFITAMMALLSVGALAHAGEEVRYFEKDGVTYRETRRVESCPVVETRAETSTQTVYREQCITEMRDTVRESWTPVTEYRWEAFWVNRWNPLAKPYMAYRYVPHTRWERSVQTVKTPVVARRLVPETRTVQVPVTRQRIVQREIIQREPVAGSSSTSVAWAPPAARTSRLLPIASSSNTNASSNRAPIAGPIGGVARLDTHDPPRESTSTAWRSSNTIR